MTPALEAVGVSMAPMPAATLGESVWLGMWQYKIPSVSCPTSPVPELVSAEAATAHTLLKGGFL